MKLTFGMKLAIAMLAIVVGLAAAGPVAFQVYDALFTFNARTGMDYDLAKVLAIVVAVVAVVVALVILIYSSMEWAKR